MVMISVITASCCQLCVTCVLCRVMCSPLSQERLQLHPVIFVPGPANTQHSLTDNGSGTGKSEAASAGGMWPVFSVCCIMIFRSGEVKVACDSIVYGHGYYQMLPVLYEPQTFLNTIFKPSQSVCTSSCSNCTSPEITNVPLAFIQLI